MLHASIKFLHNNAWMKGQNFISPKQLSDILTNKGDDLIKNVHVIDSTWLLNPPPDRKPLNEFEEVGHIPSSVFMDIEACCSPNFPPPITHMLPTYKYFSSYVNKLLNCTSVNKDETLVVVYDTLGVFSSPRAWWMFKVFGYPNVAILNGGLGKWVEEGYSIEKGKWKSSFNKPTDEIIKMVSDLVEIEVPSTKADEFKTETKTETQQKYHLTFSYPEMTSFTPSPVSTLKTYIDMKNLVNEYQKAQLNSQDKVMQNTKETSQSAQLPTILDARNAQRFKGMGTERAGLPGGHIPYSQNLCFLDLMKTHTLKSDLVDTHKLKSDTYTTMETSEDALLKILQEKNILDKTDTVQSLKHKRYVFTCGSGISACALHLAFSHLGAPWEMLSLYDGSYTEWASYESGKLPTKQK